MEETLVNNFKHTPVLLDECLDGLSIRPDGIYVDGTLGGGGHSGEILKRLTTGKLIAFDKDDDAYAKFDFLKDRIGVEVQFGHSSFIGIDFFTV